jgi:hypothetical protein
MPINYEAAENVAYCPGRMSSWKTIVRSAEAVALQEDDALHLCQTSLEALQRLQGEAEAPTHIDMFMTEMSAAVHALEQNDWNAAQHLTKALFGKQLTFMAENVAAKLDNPAYDTLEPAKQNSNFGHVCQVALNDTGEVQTQTPLLFIELMNNFPEASEQTVLTFLQQWRQAHAKGCNYSQDDLSAGYDPNLSIEDRRYVLQTLANVGREAAGLTPKDYSAGADLS